MKYRKKPIAVECNQWFKNGDHPKDHDPIEIENPTSMDLAKYDEYLQFEGKVVRRYRRPDDNGQRVCDKCGNIMHNHGWIDTMESAADGQVVCPGDWIITGVKGEYYPCKPDIFAATYELAE